ncbi:MAG TPA: DUF4837 family protein [Rhodothermales bacterium]
MRVHRLLALLLLAACALGGCKDVDYRPDAVGREAEIVVVMDDERWQGSLGDTVRAHLSDYMETLPAPEREFELRRTDIETRFEEIKTLKNVLFVAPYTDTTAVARFLRSRLPENIDEMQAAANGLTVHREDLWRRNQMVIYVTAATAEALEATIRDRAEEIRYLFNRITRERVTREMFEKGRQRDIEEQLMRKHGFAVNVQYDFRVAIDTTNFVWLRRVLSDTWRSIFVYYIEDADPSIITPQWIYATRDSVTKQWIRGNVGGFVEIDRPPRRPLETEAINFLGRYGFETRGLWQMMGEREDGTRFQFGSGGPFVTYTFYDEPSGRIYMIDGMVFAPGFEKREFLRHMEAIAYTFRGAEAPAQSAVNRRAAPPDEASSSRKRAIPVALQ